eukprot:4858778-Karenia_brevis.AAC.1
MAFSPDPMSVVTSTSATTMKSLHRLLREFANATIQYVKFALPGSTHTLFATSQVGRDRMLHYGYTNRTTHTSLMPCPPTSVQSRLDQ